jgi:VanZ family protein
LKALAIIVNIILITLCLIPIQDSVPSPFERSDLIFHGGAYAGLTFLFLLASYSLIPTASLLFAQGIVIELIQPYFARHFEFYDILANTLGVFLGLGFWKLKERVSQKLNRST